MQSFTKILLPAALPTIFVGIRLGLIFTLINVVGVEYIINFGGLGQLVNDLAERYDMPGHLCGDHSSLFWSAWCSSSQRKRSSDG